MKIFKVLDDQEMMACFFSGALGGSMFAALFTPIGWYLIIGGIIGASVCCYAEYKHRSKNEEL